MERVREVGIGKWMQKHPLPPKPESVDPRDEFWLHQHQVCHVGAKCYGHCVGRQRPSTAVCAVCNPSWHACSLGYEEVAESADHLDHDAVGFGAIMWVLHDM